MTFKKNFVVVVKHNNKVLRERNGYCTLPFGAEYSLMLKNLESRKAVVKISVDGDDVLDGNSLVIEANSSTELKGFMKGTSAKNKFKFIKKTSEIAEYRGDRVDDGIIRVEFKFEKEKKQKKEDNWYIYPTYTICPCCGCCPCICPPRKDQSWWRWRASRTDDVTFCSNLKSSNDSVNSFVPDVSSSLFNSTPLSDEGITVKGSKTNQNFTYSYTDTLEEQSSVIVIRLRGVRDNGAVVEKPLTVKSKSTCPTCGKKNRSRNIFCWNCGTCLK